jgi:hypothetical protein
MIAVSTNRTLQPHLGDTASFGTNLVFLDASTASPWQNDSKLQGSRVSTARPVNSVQFTKRSTADTRPPEWTEELPWRDKVAAGIEAQQLVDMVLGELPTEEATESLEDQFSEFIEQHGVAGITALESRLLRANDPALEPWTWVFLTALGTSRDPSIDAAARRILVGEIASP